MVTFDDLDCGFLSLCLRHLSLCSTSKSIEGGEDTSCWLFEKSLILQPCVAVGEAYTPRWINFLHESLLHMSLSPKVVSHSFINDIHYLNDYFLA